MSRPALLTAALDLAARGLPIIPAHFPLPRRATVACSCGHRGCPSAAKHPFGSLVPSGCKHATTDAKQIAQWWRQYPQLNIAIGTDSLVVLDVDLRHRGYENLAALEQQHDALPQTWTVRSGSNGLHLYFAAPRDVTISNSVGRLAPGLDIKAKGGAIIAPPSRHISGSQYRWIFAPDEAPLASVPDWLITKLTAPQLPPSPTIATSRRPSVAAVRAVLCVVASAQKGERNAILFWAACRLGEAVRDGLMSSNTALDLLINSAPPRDASFTQRAVFLTARRGLHYGANS
jgi:hypothetical protein